MPSSRTEATPEQSMACALRPPRVDQFTTIVKDLGCLQSGTVPGLRGESRAWLCPIFSGCTALIVPTLLRQTTESGTRLFRISRLIFDTMCAGAAHAIFQTGGR